MPCAQQIFLIMLAFTWNTAVRWHAYRHSSTLIIWSWFISKSCAISTNSAVTTFLHQNHTYNSKHSAAQPSSLWSFVIGGAHNGSQWMSKQLRERERTLYSVPTAPCALQTSCTPAICVPSGVVWTWKKEKHAVIGTLHYTITVAYTLLPRGHSVQRIDERSYALIWHKQKSARYHQSSRNQVMLL